jgi:crotonobetainyl-CoA:carnitine CoA-transferase CaiB-like acyl-CoA transferase
LDKREKGELPLTGFRVLDLTNERGFLCGRMLGDLGADVIKVEKPGGDPSRNIGPFYHDIPHPERSLYWFAYNANKRGITLNIETRDGQEIFKKLVKLFDCIIESFSPGYMDEFGLGFHEVSKLNPQAIMASITPFGQGGQYRDYKSSDLTILAMGGFLYITGDPDRPPLAIGHPQTYLNAGADAAVAILMAYYDRQKNGEGQYLDISMQQSIPLNLFYVIPFWEFMGVVSRRHGAFRAGLGTGVVQRMVWPCKDGFVSATIMGGAVGAKTNRGLVEWMDSEGMAPEFMKAINWDELDMSAMTQELQNQLTEPITNFFMNHTKEELYRGAIERRIMLYPVSSSKDIVENEQLNARGFWEEVKHPELGETVVYPGAWATASEMELELRLRAPLIGEHNQEIYRELGISGDELQILKQAGII